MSLDEPNGQLVDFLMREEVARHVTAMYTLERIAARDWARTRPLMASINQVTPYPTTLEVWHVGHYHCSPWLSAVAARVVGCACTSVHVDVPLSENVNIE